MDEEEEEDDDDEVVVVDDCDDEDDDIGAELLLQLVFVSSPLFSSVELETDEEETTYDTLEDEPFDDVTF